jgi:hypothetical protein
MPDSRMLMRPAAASEDTAAPGEHDESEWPLHHGQVDSHACHSGGAKRSGNLFVSSEDS